MGTVMKHASTFLLPSLPEENPSRSFALVVLNHQLPVFTPLLWKHAQLRVCADGGANRVYDEMPRLLSDEDPMDVRSRYKPDVIKGDMDSIRTEVQSFYTDLGTEIVDESHDQDTTDLHKCVSFIRNVIPDLEQSSLSILVAGALGGRFDHEIGNINILHRFSDTRITLLSDDSLVYLLPKTHQHEIYIQSSFEGPHCGLFPIGIPSARTTTTGLQWDLTESEMRFGGLISTSNIVREEKITVDYFMDCHYCASADRLWVIGGTNEGTLVYFPVNYKNNQAIYSPDAVLESGHTAIVRTVMPSSAVHTGASGSYGAIFGWTGGEDGRLCCWLSDEVAQANQSWISNSLVTKFKNRRKHHHPYQ